MRTLLRAAIGALAAGGALVLVAFRRGWFDPPPALLAAVAGAALALAAVELALTLLELPRAAARLRVGGRALVLAGVVAMGAGGLANWLLSLQGFAVLLEREAVPLFQGSHLQGFEAGPLADPAELNVVLQLDELALRPAEDGFRPESTLLVMEDGKPTREVKLGTGALAAAGSLRLRQGAFGFAPRLVLLKGEATLLDETVVFETRRVGARGVAFEGGVDVPEHRMRVTGEMSLDDLDDRLRGHPILGVRVERDGKLLGKGELEPGHFAELDGGYRIGLAGVSRWAEVDVSRRDFGAPVRAGALAVLAGLVAWAAGALRRSREEAT